MGKKDSKKREPPTGRELLTIVVSGSSIQLGEKEDDNENTKN